MVDYRTFESVDGRPLDISRAQTTKDMWRFSASKLSALRSYVEDKGETLHDGSFGTAFLFKRSDYGEQMCQNSIRHDPNVNCDRRESWTQGDLHEV